MEEQDAGAATVNRVTFYAHYTGKFFLLECVVATRFNELLAKRRVTFDGTCSSALSGIVLAVRDYLAGTAGPHLESAVIAVVRRMILDGLKQHPWDRPVSPEMLATAVSWAIYGAAQEWVRTPNRPPSEDIVGPLVTLVSPLDDAGDAARRRLVGMIRARGARVPRHVLFTPRN